MNSQSVFPSKLVSVDGARAILGGIGRTKLYELIGTGELRAVKLGRRTLFVEAEILAYADALPRGTLGAATPAKAFATKRYRR
jgi:excisionase family DNA binding protein